MFATFFIVLRDFAQKPLVLLARAVLALALVAMLLYATRDVGLLLSQLLTLVIATIALGSTCVWIIGWE